MGIHCQLSFFDLCSNADGSAASGNPLPVDYLRDCEGFIGDDASRPSVDALLASSSLSLPMTTQISFLGSDGQTLQPCYVKSGGVVPFPGSTR